MTGCRDRGRLTGKNRSQRVSNRYKTSMTETQRSTPLARRKAVIGAQHDELTETLKQSSLLIVQLNTVASEQGQLAYFDVPRLPWHQHGGRSFCVFYVWCYERPRCRV